MAEGAAKPTSVCSGGMTSQLGQVALHVPEGEPNSGLLGVGEQVGGEQLGTLDHAHGENRRTADGRGVAQVSKRRFVPSASVKQTGRDMGCAGIPDLRRQSQMPCGIAVVKYE
jgi:hypothetical protein